MESFGIFYAHLVYFTTIWYTLGTFCILCCNLVYFPPFWYFVPRKIWQPWLELRLVTHRPTAQVWKPSDRKNLSPTLNFDETENFQIRMFNFRQKVIFISTYIETLTTYISNVLSFNGYLAKNAFLLGF
jgi:hypothetical protein